MTADVVLFSIDPAAELIAHEIEHLIEQLDAVVIKPDACNHGAVRSGTLWESCRAVEAGRRVLREVQAAHARRTLTVRLGDSAGGVLAPASAAVSANGRFVALRSEVGLVPADTNDGADIYVLDTDTGDLQLESARPGWADAYSTLMSAQIAGDGQWLFVLAAAPAIGTPSGVRCDIVMLDRLTGSARTIDSGLEMTPLCPNSRWAVSADGTSVVFECRSRAVEPGRHLDEICLARLQAGLVQRIRAHDNATSNSCSVAEEFPRNTGQSPSSHYMETVQDVTPAINGDGRYVVFTSIRDRRCTRWLPCPNVPRGSRRVSDIYLFDTHSGAATCITRAASGQPANGRSYWPVISADGRFIAFASEASNLIKGDSNRAADVFLYDRVTGSTHLVSRRPDGNPGNDASMHPAISGDGRSVAFQSLASDLLCPRRCPTEQRDINLLSDVFVYDRSSGAMTRASEDDDGGWMESSRGPALDHTGRVLAFSSRHPLDNRDLTNDDDLYVVVRGLRERSPSGVAGTVATVSVGVPPSNRR